MIRLKFKRASRFKILQLEQHLTSADKFLRDPMRVDLHELEILKMASHLL